MVYFQTKLRKWIDINKLNFSKLSFNSNAFEILKNNIDLIDWSNLTKNTNHKMLELLKYNYIDWYLLSGNSSAISILEKNEDKLVAYR